MSYTEKAIELTISLADGTFDGASDTVTLSGLRISAQVTAYGGENNPLMSCRVFGLPLSMMNRLTRIGAPDSVGSSNAVSIAAGDVGSALTTVFQGNILWAWADMQGIPETALYLEAVAGGVTSLKPVKASSFMGTADVATIMQGLATMAGWNFENNGVDVKLQNPYLPGTVMRQIQSCAKAAGISYVIDKNTLAIWPMYGARKTSPVPVLSVGTGLVGYPVFASNYVVVTSEFNPLLNIGTQVKVETMLTAAAKTLNIWAFEHDIESQMPGGAWYTRITGLPS